MALHEDTDDYSPFEHNYEDDRESLHKRKQVKRMLEDRLERKRLKEEFQDDFDELGGDFDWDKLSK